MPEKRINFFSFLLSLTYPDCIMFALTVIHVSNPNFQGLLKAHKRKIRPQPFMVRVPRQRRLFKSSKSKSENCYKN